MRSRGEVFETVIPTGCIDWAAKRALDHKSRTELGIVWQDVTQSWELEVKSAIAHKRMDQPYRLSGESQDLAQPPSSGGQTGQSSKKPKAFRGGSTKSTASRGRPRNNRSPAPSMTVEPEAKQLGGKAQGKGKRRNASPSMIDEPKAKRPRGEVQGQKEEAKLSPAGQLGFYALERMCCSGKLPTQRVSYSQGCIAFESIDIIDSLPVFVGMVAIFQRFPAWLWGLVLEPIRLKTEADTTYTIPSCRPAGNFQLLGRRTFTSSLPIVAPTPTHRTRSTPKNEDDGSQLPPAFFKSSWPEVDRISEPKVIKTARERAYNLPDQFRCAVLDHFPEVLGWDRVPVASTAMIRRLIGLPTQGERHQVWMISKKLETLIEQEPKVVWEGGWELVRCHSLLWQIGIAHGDISLFNLMYDHSTAKAVLNDFDLATVMDPGIRIPPKAGFTRTGTKPFMALELLRGGPSGEVTRRYRHGFESFFWTQLVVSLCVKDRKLDLKQYPINEWLTGDMNQIYLKKQDFNQGYKRAKIRSLISKDYKEYAPALQAIASYWHDWMSSMDEKSFETSMGQNQSNLNSDGDNDVDDSDEEHLSGIINKLQRYDCALPDALEDIEWATWDTSMRAVASTADSSPIIE